MKSSAVPSACFLMAMLTSVSNATPSLAPLLGGDADARWSVTSGEFLAATNAVIGRPVLVVGRSKWVMDGKLAATNDVELHALVSLKTEAQSVAVATFLLGRTEGKDAGFALQLSATRNTEVITASAIHNGQPLHDLKALTAKLDWDCPFSNVFYYNLRAYTTILPGWPEDYRARIEHDMALLPDHNQKWLDVRIALRAGHVEFWLDDRLVAIRDSAEIKPNGMARVELDPGIALASCSVRPLTPGARQFVPIQLGGYANACRFFRDQAVKTELLPSPGEPVAVDGVPFVFSGVNVEGNDHLDVGKSLYREANSMEYMLAYQQPWGGSALRDPARIQLRIPNGQYDTLYLIAGSDDERDSIPLVTAAFFRPGAGFPVRFESRVPLATARSSDARRLPVELANGRKASLWLVKVPLDPGQLSSFADLDIVEVELSKKMYQYRYYPDPAQYSWHQGGSPSAVHIFAATLGRVPAGFTFAPYKFGHVWTSPEIPIYTASVTNHLATDQVGSVGVMTRSYDGAEKTEQTKPVRLRKGESVALSFSIPVKRNGYHDISATLSIAGRTWTEKRSFVRLAPDTRTTQWTEGKGALFGFWSYAGGHYTPKYEPTIELMVAAGARVGGTYSFGRESIKTNALVLKHWARNESVNVGVPQPWAKEDPIDPKKYEAYQQQTLGEFKQFEKGIPEKFRPDYVAIFGESVISDRLTSGNYPEYWGAPPYELTGEEKERIRSHSITARCIAESFRKNRPDLKILLEWGDPLYPVPLLRAGFPTNLVDGTALDSAGFERLPEQQLHQVSLHRLYELRSEFAKVGIRDPVLLYQEGPFFPTEVGALSWKEQMDIQDRFTLISMAYGVKRFYSGWFTFDNGDWVGAEHYGGCGIQRRIPYCDPKPAYASYATMTDRLNEANFVDWLKTGSLSTYCLHFRSLKGNVYTLWTVRGRRPVTLTLADDAEVAVTDAMNNTRTVQSQNRQLTIPTDPSVVYVTTTVEVAAVEVGAPDHSDVAPDKGAVAVANLGDGSWRYTSERDLTYENNNFDTARYPGRFTSTTATDAECGKVLLSRLEKQDKVHELMPWYNTLTPSKPLVLKGAPLHIGLWVKGASDWGRLVYCLRDANGERWISVGTKDQWNCDDLHSWSAFNFDGWRYVRFEMPGHTGYDSYRRHGTSWWGSHGGDGIVDLPLTLEKIIVEQRTHILYVNDVQPVASDTVCFGKLYAEYESADDSASEAVRINKLRMPLPQGVPELPNPIADWQRTGIGEPTTITKLEPPAEQNAGTSVHVHFQEVPGAKSHFIWVSAHEDGRGAVNMTPSGAKSGVLITDLRPAVKFHFWVTWQDAQGRMSKPSPARETTLVDSFKEK